MQNRSFHKRVSDWIRDNPGKKYRIYRYNIDGFRNINGLFGYAAGNQLLKDIGLYLASTDNENAVNLDDITVDVTISPAEAEIGETVTLSANITSPNGLDGVKMQWQYCVLKIVDGIAC